MKMYSIKDQAAEAFMTPFSARTHGEAIRGFYFEASNPESMIARSPADFYLFYIGEFHQDTGEFEPALPCALANGLESKQALSPDGKSE